MSDFMCVLNVSSNYFTLFMISLKFSSRNLNINNNLLNLICIVYSDPQISLSSISQFVSTFKLSMKERDKWGEAERENILRSRELRNANINSASPVPFSNL